MLRCEKVIDVGKMKRTAQETDRPAAQYSSTCKLYVCLYIYEYVLCVNDIMF